MKEETEEKRQCSSCGQWVDESEMMGDICVDCQVTFFEDEDAE